MTDRERTQTVSLHCGIMNSHDVCYLEDCDCECHIKQKKKVNENE